MNSFTMHTSTVLLGTIPKTVITLTFGAWDEVDADSPVPRRGTQEDYIEQPQTRSSGSGATPLRWPCSASPGAEVHVAVRCKAVLRC
jgi:hypothetical protein